jgi:hypothetical protein
MNRELVEACFLKNSSERVWTLGTGNLDAVLRSIGEALRAIRKSMEVSGRQTQAFKKAARGLHQRPSPFIKVKRRPGAGMRQDNPE